MSLDFYYEVQHVSGWNIGGPIHIPSNVNCFLCSSLLPRGGRHYVVAVLQWSGLFEGQLEGRVCGIIPVMLEAAYSF